MHLALCAAQTPGNSRLHNQNCQQPSAHASDNNLAVTAELV
jgi:hypothetical protein